MYNIPLMAGQGSLDSVRYDADLYEVFLDFFSFCSAIWNCRAARCTSSTRHVQSHARKCFRGYAGRHAVSPSSGLSATQLVLLLSAVIDVRM